MVERPSAEETIRALARRDGERVRTTNLVWPNLGGGPFTLTCKLKRFALPLRLSSNRDWLLADVEHPTSLSFAGMQPDRAVQLLNRPIGVYAGVSVFVSQAAETLELMRWLGSHASELRELVDPEREHFMIVENRSFFFLAPSEIERTSERLAALVSVLQQLPPLETAEPDPAPALPQSLSHLASVLDHWGITDDEARGELIEDAPDRALAALRDAVLVRLGEIDALLDEQDIPAMHGLAQAAIEADLELRRRRQQARDT